jgi:small subunit ribosomal protein S4
MGIRLKTKYKIARRLGAPIFEKTQTQKFALSESRRKPVRRRGRPTEYGIQMVEKQKARFTYGLSEKQFRGYVNKALSAKGAKPADVLMSLMEGRLDNIVFRAGIVPTRAFARQIVSHGHMYVNGRRITVPSYQMSKKDVVTIKASSLTKPVFAEVQERITEAKSPEWLNIDIKKMEITLKDTPHVNHSDLLFDLSSVLEFYSR